MLLFTEKDVDGGGGGGGDLECSVVSKIFSCANFASRVTGGLAPPGFLPAPSDRKSWLRLCLTAPVVTTIYDSIVS
jgi:hypothetical protein